MSIRFIQSSPRTIVAALALSLGLAANAFAMPPGDAAVPGARIHGHAMSHHGKAMQRLHDELKLDAQQEALWQDAVKFAKEGFEGKREQFGKHRQEIDALLSQPGADLREVAKRMDAFRADGQKQRDAVRERWLKVYDTLDAEQKEKVRLFFKSGA